MRRLRGTLVGLTTVALLVGCSEELSRPTAPVPDFCNLIEEFLADGGVGRDGILSLTDPEMIPGLPLSLDNGYVLPGDRVIGLLIDGDAIAIPHNVLWTHEIVNLTWGDLQLAISYCPLTGTALVFDRASVGGDEFGVSGLLYQNNLIMFNRRTDESLFPQMWGEARCGPQTGLKLARYPAIEMTWGGWLSLYPESVVVSGRFDVAGNYRVYPYGDYEVLNSGFFFPMPDLDDRRLPKERVLGIPTGSGVAFPYFELNEQGPWGAADATVAGDRIVVFWDRARISAMAYRPSLNGELLQFDVTDQGIFDLATGSRWSVDGQAREGPLAGSRLDPVESAYVAFWAPWAAFHPNTALWTNDGGT